VFVLRPEHSPSILLSVLIGQGFQVEISGIAVQREFVTKAIKGIRSFNIMMISRKRSPLTL